MVKTEAEFIKQRRTAALLSFLLPGLGQVYLAHYRRGVAVFAAFTLMVWLRDARVFLPLASFLAAAEAYRLANYPKERLEWDGESWWGKLTQPRPGKPRIAWYAVIASLGFVNWFLIFSYVLYPFEKNAQALDQAERLADRVRAYVQQHDGQYPDTLANALHPEDNVVELLTDPWGDSYQLRRVGDGFEIKSLGRDRRPSTKDDLTYRFH